MILIKCSSRSRSTHNSDGRYKKTWRLFDTGKVERTNSRSRYVAPFIGDTVPKIIKETAYANGLELSGFRKRGQSHCTKK